MHNLIMYYEGGIILLVYMKDVMFLAERDRERSEQTSGVQRREAVVARQPLLVLWCARHAHELRGASPLRGLWEPLA